jgi:hypothetical protein
MADRILSHVPGMKTASAIPVLDAATLSVAVFRDDYVANSRPCVIAGAVRHWPAFVRWRDKDYLKRQSGHHGVDLFLSELHVTKKRMQGNIRAASFAEAVDYLHAEETGCGMVVTGDIPECLADVGDIPFVDRSCPAFWYHPARCFFFRNAGSAWHHHPFDETLMCQVIGSKQIGLARADGSGGTALRDIFFREDYYDDPSAFADFDGTAVAWMTATLQAGDALYIPPLWWHGVIPLSADFGVTTPVTWQSPPHVVAKCLGKIARGEIDMIGKTSAPNVQGLVDVARRLGLERELAVAWDRGV